MICPRCSVAEVSPHTGRCVLCGYVPPGGVAVQDAIADEVLETVQRELADRFELQALLRWDRRSTLYAARDLQDDRLVSLRLIPRPGPVDSELLQRFEQAAAVASQLRHPHLVPVQRFGVTHSLLWYSMDSLKGRTLATAWERGSVTLAVCQPVIEQVAGALEYLHRNGVVHGGLHPTSVMVDAEGWARVTDAGIMAAIFRASVPRSEWEAILDPAYAAPEVLERRFVGPAADQYALALLAYRGLVGRPAFTGATLDEVRREVSAGIEPLEVARPDVPAYAATAIARALRPVPGDRFGSVLDFVAVLGGAVLRPAGVGGRPGGSMAGPPVLVIPGNEPEGRWRRRIVWGVLLVALGAGAGIGVHRLTTPPPTGWTPTGPSAQPAAPPVTQTPAAPVEAAAPPATPPPTDGAAAVVTRPTPVAPVAEPVGTATLFLNSRPWGTVSLDGENIGNTPRANVTVPAGTHVLRIARDGYVTFQREIRLTVGETLRITDIVLEPIRP